MQQIYDVGVENGEDSAYYLHKGYRVVGVEANPVAIDKLRTRFAGEIGDGRYVLVPVGIAAQAGEARFWVCDDYPQWSSFDRSIASRQGSRHHEVRIETRPFRSILEEFGPASYCKIDIEGNDNLCVRDLSAGTRPPYISVELIDGDEQLHLLRDQGYTGFKIISQRLFRPLSPEVLNLYARLPPPARRLVNGLASRAMRYQPEAAWRFRGGSSGPFGEATAGRWRSFEEACRTWDAIRNVGERLYDWHDIHARLEP